MDKTQVLIAGAGPTGLTLACELARRNIAIRIIDRLPAYPNGSRAKGLQPRSLEVLDGLGLAEKAMQSGNNNLIFRRFMKEKMVGEAGRDNSNPRTDTLYRHSLLIPQWRIEQLLREKLAEFGVSVELNASLESFEQTEQDVTATILKDGLPVQIQCGYMVACDGGKSTTRKALGINFIGETHEDERMLIGDVEVDGLVPDAWHVWLHPQYGMGIALCPFAGTNSWQLQAIAVPGEDGNIPEPTLENFNRIFQEHANMPNVLLKNVTWQSIYRVNVRMADKYRVGRAFIAGDAAHAHSIAGGLGMNTGIQDAYNLGWKLAAVLNEGAGASLLDTYEEERLPIAAWTLNITNERQKAVVDAAKSGKGGMETSATKDTTQLNLHYRQSPLSINLIDEPGLLQAGDRAPDVIVEDKPTGYKLRLFDYYRGAAFTVLAFGEACAEIVKPINARFKEKASAYLVSSEEHSDTPVIDDRLKAVYNAFGGHDAIYVIRPDGYIGLIANPCDEKAVMQYLQRFIA